MAVSITSLTDGLRDYLVAVAKNNATLTPDQRGYIFSHIGYDKSLSQSDINDFFSRTELNANYQKNYNNLPVKPYSFIQAEIDMIYSFHKSFSARYKGRLSQYRDDLSQKSTRTVQSLDNAMANFEIDRDNSIAGAIGK